MVATLNLEGELSRGYTLVLEEQTDATAHVYANQDGIRKAIFSGVSRSTRALL